MIVLQPDGTVTNVKYTSYKDIGAAVSPPGRDDPFTAVPVLEGPSCGYSVYVNDLGDLISLASNRFAAALCLRAAVLYGSVAIVSFEEANETDLLGCIEKDQQENFHKRLRLVLSLAKQIGLQTKSAEN